VAIVNGPGELCGWLLPAVEHLKARAPDMRITAVITPCQYASGRERDVAAASPAIDEVVTFASFVRRSWANRPARGQSADTLVVHFGGDPFYSRVAGALSRAPVWRFGTSAAGRRWTKRFLVPDDRIRTKLIRQGVAADRITVVGQIVVDSVLPAQSQPRHPEPGPVVGERVLLLPGSRLFELERMVPFFARVIDETLSRRPGTVFAMSLSSFVTRAQFRTHALAASCDVVESGPDLWLGTPRGYRCRVLEGGWHAAAGPEALAVTLPGTNTLQLAALGTPMLVLLPLNWGERIPLDGLLGLLLPVALPFGLVKRYLVRAMASRVRYLALPNILASERIVPEMRGVLQPPAVAEAVAALMADSERRAAMSARLRDVAGQPGAADRTAAAILGCHETAVRTA
jgi:lipid-A-disaccharide synthase